MQIKSIEQLKELATNETLECALSLANGAIRSSKEIFYNPETQIFSITNCIDDTEQELTEAELFDPTITLIGEAIKKGALII